MMNAGALGRGPRQGREHEAGDENLQCVSTTIHAPMPALRGTPQPLDDSRHESH